MKLSKPNKQESIQDITKYTILHDHVLVRGIKIEEVNGILKPDSYDDKPKMGKVITVGLGRMVQALSSSPVVRIPLTVKKGQTVLFNEYSSTKYNLNGDDYYIIREEDIVGFQD